MEYALPYLLLVVFLGFLAFVFESREDSAVRSAATGLALFVVVIFFGFRGFCFYDWNSYYPEYQAFQLRELIELPITKWRFEPGFQLLMTGCKAIVDNFHFFVFVCTCLNTALLLNFLRRRIDNIPLALTVCICMNGIILFTDLMRNSISILIFMNTLGYLKERRPIPYFLLNLLGMTFHLSSAAFLPLYFVLHRRWPKWIYLAFFGAGNAIYLLHIPVFLTIVSVFLGFVNPDLQWKVHEYTELMANEEFRLSIGYLERLLTGILVFLYIDKLRELREDNDIFINSILLYLVMFLFFSEFKTIATRMSMLFSYGYWIIWIDLIRCFAIANNRRLFVAFLSIYCLFKMYGSTNYIIARYDNVLFGAEPYNQRVLIYDRNFNEI